MTEETAQRASTLLANKAEVMSVLAEVVSSRGLFVMFTGHSKGSIDLDWCEPDLRAFLLKKVKAKLDEIDEELNTL